MLPCRGMVVGMGLGCGLARGSWRELAYRAWFGFGFGAVAYAGIDMLRDFLSGPPQRGRVQSCACLRRAGGARGVHRRGDRVLPRRRPGWRGRGQVPPLPRRGPAAGTHDVYPLLSKWGHLDLGRSPAASSLLFAEALPG